VISNLRAALQHRDHRFAPYRSARATKQVERAKILADAQNGPRNPHKRQVLARSHREASVHTVDADDDAVAYIDVHAMFDAVVAATEGAPVLRQDANVGTDANAGTMIGDDRLSLLERKADQRGRLKPEPLAELLLQALTDIRLVDIHTQTLARREQGLTTSGPRGRTR
jgi:hypothetical protein